MDEANDPILTLDRWLVPDGAIVERGQAIAEVVTDAAMAEIEAWSSGTLRHLVQPGDAITSRTRIAAIIPTP